MSEGIPVGGQPSPPSRVPLEWVIPNDLHSQYATNLVIQSGTNEIIISFFEVRPPILLGSPEEREAAARQIQSIPAVCVARVIVAQEKMPEFIKAFQDHSERSQSTSKSKKSE